MIPSSSPSGNTTSAVTSPFSRSANPSCSVVCRKSQNWDTLSIFSTYRSSIPVISVLSSPTTTAISAWTDNASHPMLLTLPKTTIARTLISRMICASIAGSSLAVFFSSIERYRNLFIIPVIIFKVIFEVIPVLCTVLLRSFRLPVRITCADIRVHIQEPHRLCCRPAVHIAAFV